MKLKVFRPLAVIIIVALMAGPSFAEKSLTVSISIEESEIYVGRVFHLKVTVSWKGDWGELFVSYPDKPEGLKLDVIGSASSVYSRSTSTGVETIREMSYEVIPREEGRGMISAITVVVKDKATGEETNFDTKPINVEIKPAPSSIISLIQEKSRSKYAMPAGVTLALLVIIITVILRVRSGKERSSHTREVEEAIHPREIFFVQMDDAENHRIARDTKAYFDAVEKAIRSYASERWEIPVRGGWDAFIDKLHAANVEDELITRLEAFYELAKRVKFGGEVPSADEIDQVRNALRTAL